MYFLRKIIETSENEILYSDLAIYIHNKYDRLYRKTFYYLNFTYDDMKLYTTNSLSEIIELRKVVYSHCNEWFDVYDEELNKVNIEKVFKIWGCRQTVRQGTLTPSFGGSNPPIPAKNNFIGVMCNDRNCK